jgi:hypothetical protein
LPSPGSFGAGVCESVFGGVGIFLEATAPATYMPTSQVIVFENVFIRLSLPEESELKSSSQAMQTQKNTNREKTNL